MVIEALSDPCIKKQNKKKRLISFKTFSQVWIFSGTAFFYVSRYSKQEKKCFHCFFFDWFFSRSNVSGTLLPLEIQGIIRSHFTSRRTSLIRSNKNS